MKYNTMILNQVVVDLSRRTQHQTDRSTILADKSQEAVSQCWTIALV
jgi:hypothetical protein